MYRCDLTCNSFGAIIIDGYKECLYFDSCPSNLPLIQIFSINRYCTATCESNNANYFNVVDLVSNVCLDMCTPTCTTNCATTQ